MAGIEFVMVEFAGKLRSCDSSSEEVLNKSAIVAQRGASKVPRRWPRGGVSLFFLKSIEADFIFRLFP